MQVQAVNTRMNGLNGFAECRSDGGVGHREGVVPCSALIAIKYMCGSARILYRHHFLDELEEFARPCNILGTKP